VYSGITAEQLDARVSSAEVIAGATALRQNQIPMDWTGHLREARHLALAGLRSGQTAFDSLGFMAFLADIALKQGRRSEAARYDALLATAAQTLSSAPEATFLRATIAGRRGDRLQAVRLLEQARALGSNMILHVITHREPALAALRDYPPPAVPKAYRLEAAAQLRPSPARRGLLVQAIGPFSSACTKTPTLF